MQHELITPALRRITRTRYTGNRILEYLPVQACFCLTIST